MRFADGNFRKDLGSYINPCIHNDGYKWTLLETRYECADWIDLQDSALWKLEGGHHRARYWVRDELLMILELKWGT